MVPTDGNIVGTWCKFILATATFTNFGDRGTKEVFHGAIYGDFYSLPVYLKADILSRGYWTKARIPHEDGQIVSFIHPTNLNKRVITRVNDAMTI